MVRKASVTQKKNSQALKIARLAAHFASDKKAEDIVLLDMRKAANFCDYFLLCTGTSDRQMHAIARGIEEGLEEKGIELRYRQGVKDARWVLLDLGPVVVHVFSRDARQFYGLEYLWQEAKQVPCAL